MNMQELLEKADPILKQFCQETNDEISGMNEWVSTMWEGRLKSGRHFQIRLIACVRENVPLSWGYVTIYKADTEWSGNALLTRQTDTPKQKEINTQTLQNFVVGEQDYNIWKESFEVKQ